MTNQMTTLGDDFPIQLERVRELLGIYQSLPMQSGFFGAAILKDLIKRAETAQAENDIVAMVRTYAEMKEAQ
jgi:hypothetical protein